MNLLRKIRLNYLFGIVVLILLIGFDQVTKAYAVTALQDHADKILIPGVLQLHYLENIGAAFSTLEGKQTFFKIFTPIVCLLILYLQYHIPNTKRFRLMYWILNLLLAGAFGNYIDRVTQEYVVDFIYVSLIHFPVFNVADIYVTVAVIALIVAVVFYYKDEELDALNPFRKSKGK